MHKKSKKNFFEKSAEKTAEFVAQPEKLFALIFIFGVLTIVGGVLFWRVNIYKAFTVNSLDQRQSELSSQQAIDDYNKLLADQQKDTDKDGLSDYFELNIYNTSPYLPDTDSDGISDKDEIDQNKNPNCPEGSECVILSPDSNQGQDLGQVADEVAAGAEFDFNVQVGREMRSLLLENGVDPDLLDSLTDSELAQIYQQVVAEENQVALEDVPAEEIDPATLRQLLLNSGVDQNLLDGLTDQELMDVYYETLQSENL